MSFWGEKNMFLAFQSNFSAIFEEHVIMDQYQSGALFKKDSGKKE